MKHKYIAKCLVCDHSGKVYYESKEDYQEVSVCPKCNGAFVDTWKLYKYKNKNKRSEEEMKGNKIYKIKTKFKSEILVRDVYSIKVEDGFLTFRNGSSDIIYAIELSYVLSYEIDNNLPTHLEGSE